MNVRSVIAKIGNSPYINLLKEGRSIRNIIIGLLAAFALILILIFSSLSSISGLTDNIDDILKPDQKIGLLEKIENQIRRAERSVYSFIIAQDKDYIIKFISSKNNTNSLIQQMVTEVKIGEFPAFDTARIYIREKFLVMDEMVRTAEGAQPGIALEKLASKINSQKNDLEQGAKNVPRSSLFDKEDSLALDVEVLQAIREKVIASRGTLDEQTLNYNDIQRDKLIALMERDQELMTLIYAKTGSVKHNWREEKREAARQSEQGATTTKNTATILNWVFPILFLTLAVLILNYALQNLRLQHFLRTEKSRAEKLGKAKEEFLANMSHEIRTPMNAVIGFTEQLGNTYLNDKQEEYVSTIGHAANHLLSLINDVLDYSKLDSGSFQLDSIPFSLEKILDEVYHTFQLQADKKGLNWSVEMQDSLERDLEGDPLRLKQMLFNLVSNAMKFTHEGEVLLYSKTLDHSHDYVLIEIGVIDTGVGIPKDKLPQLFNKFSQADKSITREFGGTGLGLAITRELARMHHGDAFIQSEEGRGSVVSVQLRYAFAAGQAVREANNRQQMSYEALSGKYALVADDTAYNLSLISTILDNWKIKADLVENGRRAVQKIENNTYDFVLLDLQMPELSGFEVAQHIREELKLDVPILALTATSSPEEIKQCRSIGMQGCLLKPFKEEELANYLLQFLQNRPNGSPLQSASSYNTTMPTNSPNFDQLQRLTNNNPQKMQEMLGIFTRNAQSYSQDIRTNFEKRNWEGVAKSAHQLIPQCRHLGLTGIVGQLKEIELNVENKKSDLTGLISQTLSLVQDAIGQVEAKIKEIR